MTTESTPAKVRLSDGLGPAAEARWYCVDRNGVSMLCANEADANWEVADNTKLLPKCAPYIAVRIVGQQQPLTRQQIEDLMTEHYPLDSGLRENMDAFEACVRRLELGVRPVVTGARRC